MEFAKQLKKKPITPEIYSYLCRMSIIYMYEYEYKNINMIVNLLNMYAIARTAKAFFILFFLKEITKMEMEKNRVDIKNSNFYVENLYKL